MIKYNNLVRGFFNDQPQHIIFYVTSKCNAKCNFCFFWKEIEKKNKDELSLKEIKKIAHNISPITYLSLTGGEPFLRPDLPQICSAFKNKTEFIHIPTNGILTESIIKNFEKILITCNNVFFKISLSLDDIGEGHDRIRNVKGCFKHLMNTYNGLMTLKDRYDNFELNVITTLSSFNQDRIIRIIDFVHSLGVDNHNINLVRGDTRLCKARNVDNEVYRGAITYLDRIRTRRERMFTLRLMHSMKYLTRDIVLQTLVRNSMVLPCVAGRKLIVIRENGDVYPCEMLKDFKLGNLKTFDYNLKKLLKSDRSLKIRKWISENKCFCTFECAIQNNIVFNPKAWLLLGKYLLK